MAQPGRPRNTFTQWMHLTPNGIGSPDSPAPAGQVPAPEPWFRSVLDRRMAAWRTTPESSFPDGYLGTISDRREGRIKRLPERSVLNRLDYHRGVHVGERLDPAEYEWPDEWGFFHGIESEAQGRRQVPVGGMAGDLAFGANLEAARGPVVAGSPVMLDPRRRAVLAQAAPPWR